MGFHAVNDVKLLKSYPWGKLKSEQVYYLIMSYWSDWVEVDLRNIRKFRWKGNEEPTGYREVGTLLVYYQDEKVSYNPVLYGWFVLLSSVENRELKADIISGVTCSMKKDSELLHQICDVMNLDDLERTLLIRLHAVMNERHEDYGLVSRSDFEPLISCTLLAFLMEKHRGRTRTDTWSRSAATHKSPTAEKIRTAYNGIPDSKLNAMERVVQFTSTTAQSSFPKMSTEKQFRSSSGKESEQSKS